MIPKVHAQSRFHSAKDQRWKDTNKYFYDSERQFLITIFNNGLDSELNTVFYEIHHQGIWGRGERGEVAKLLDSFEKSRYTIRISPPRISAILEFQS